MSATAQLLDCTELFISEYYGNKISKIDLTPLSINDFSIEKKLILYPNPTSDLIQISGLTNQENYRLYNQLGKELIGGSIFNNDKIDVQNLTNGLYFLKFKNGNTLKFLKE